MVYTPVHYSHTSPMWKLCVLDYSCSAAFMGLRDGRRCTACCLADFTTSRTSLEKCKFFLVVSILDLGKMFDLMDHLNILKKTVDNGATKFLVTNGTPDALLFYVRTVDYTPLLNSLLLLL